MIKRLPNGRWQARHRPVPGGQQVARNFDRKLDATRWLDEQKAAVLTGQYVDPRAGRVTFREYAEAWRAAQVHRPSTVANLESLLRRHAYPRFGDRPLASIRPSEVQAWAKGLALAPATVGVVHAAMSSIMKAAVRDRILVSNPCEGTKLPRQQRAPVVPMTLEQVEAVRAELDAKDAGALSAHGPAAAAYLPLIEATGPHFDIALLHRSPKDSIPAQRAHVARILENLVADSWGSGSDWWARYHETMREANNRVDARFGSISSKEVGLLEGFFNLTARQYLQTKWTIGSR